LEATRLPEGIPGTLGAVIYANPAVRAAPEAQWLRLVRSVSAGDLDALYELYSRTHRLVFTLTMRITCNREIAEELTLDVYYDVWRKAAGYSAAAQGSVVAWIMNQARAAALDRLRLQQPGRPGADAGLLTIDAPDYRHVVQIREQGRVLRQAIALLAADERAALEAVYFSELTHVEAAARLNAPPGAIGARIRSALHKLGTAFTLPTGRIGPAEYVNDCDRSALVCVHAARGLGAAEVAGLEDHLGTCTRCRRELDTLRRVIDAFVVWPTAVLRPSASLDARFAQRMATRAARPPVAGPVRQWEPEWEDVAPAIACKLLATDAQKHMVTMLVRLAPGGTYPSHDHAGREELHLLDGELWIDERKLYPGDYYRAEAGSCDQRVWSETGCACVLITSTRDLLR
jgi:RNA polymerase sigma factor (sigma-70 family)